MTCSDCKKTVHSLTFVKGDRWICTKCTDYGVVDAPWFRETVHYKNYFKAGGNVSKARVAMVKSRCLAPDGKGEVVMKNHAGRPSDKRAYNY